MSQAGRFDMRLFRSKTLPAPARRCVDGLGDGFYVVLLFTRSNAAGHARDFVRFNLKRQVSLVDSTPAVPGAWDVIVLPDSGSHPLLSEVLAMTDPLSDRAILVIGELSKAVRARVLVVAGSSTYRDYVTVLERGKSAGRRARETHRTAPVELDRSDESDRASAQRVLTNRTLSVRERLEAAEQLGQLGDEVPVQALVDVVNLPYDRERAIEVLSEFGAFDRLIEALSDEDVDVCTAAADALGRRGDTGAVEALIAALGHSREPIRICVIAALGRLGDVRAVEPLIDALDDGSHNVRRAAAESLGRLGDGKAVEPLIGALDDDSHNVRESAAAALHELGGAEAECALSVYKKLPRSRLP